MTDNTEAKQLRSSKGFLSLSVFHYQSLTIKLNLTILCSNLVDTVGISLVHSLLILLLHVFFRTYPFNSFIRKIFLGAFYLPDPILNADTL